MERSRYRNFFSDALGLAASAGTTLQQDEMAGLVAFGSNFLHHLEDQEAGIEDKLRNPHHPQNLLKSSLFGTALDVARLRKQILKTSSQSS